MIRVRPPPWPANFTPQLGILVLRLLSRVTKDKMRHKTGKSYKPRPVTPRKFNL